MLLALLVSVVVVAEPPNSLERLVGEARDAAAAKPSGSGISSEFARRAEVIVGFGAEAIPLTVPLLKHPSANVRSFFGYVVRDLPGLTVNELPALIAAHRDGNGWVAPAIASIKAPEAVAFLVQAFARRPHNETQLTWALKTLGGRGAAALVASLKDQTRVGPQWTEAACGIFREIKEPTAAVAPELVELLNDVKAPANKRTAALRLLGCSSPLSPETRAAIDAAVRRSPALARDEAVRAVQRQLGTPDGIAISLERLVAHPEEVGQLGSAGRAAPEAEFGVLAVLDNPTAEIRLEAIETLGVIGGERSVARLAELLSDPRDWRAPCEAARALSNLKATQRVSAIREAARTAWYPPTAACMTSAATALELGRPPEQRGFDEVPDGEPFRLSPAPSARRGPDELDERARNKLRVAGKIVGWSETGRHVQNVSSVPLFGLSVDGGVLVGTDRGEWGGELALLGRGGQRLLVEENVHGIHRVGSQVMVATGLAHLGTDSGAIHLVVTGSDGGLQASEWRVLPGAPTHSFLLPNGRLFVSCNGGDVVIDEGGTMALATSANTQ
jgi:HEAT repeat protein